MSDDISARAGVGIGRPLDGTVRVETEGADVTITVRDKYSWSRVSVALDAAEFAKLVEDVDAAREHRQNLEWRRLAEWKRDMHVCPFCRTGPVYTTIGNTGRHFGCHTCRATWTLPGEM